MKNFYTQFLSVRKKPLELWPLTILLLTHHQFIQSFSCWNLKTYIVSTSPLLFMSVIIIWPRFIFRTILPKRLNFIHIILEVPLAVTFFSSEKVLFNMVYAPYASMELKYGIPSLLILETLHQSEISRINLKNSFYNLTVTKRMIQILSRRLVIYWYIDSTMNIPCL